MQIEHGNPLRVRYREICPSRMSGRTWTLSDVSDPAATLSAAEKKTVQHPA